MNTQAHLNKLRQDKFLFVLNLPEILKGIDTGNARENDLLNLDSSQFSVYNLTIPSINIPEHPLHYSGQNYNVTSYDRPAYAPITINFEVDNEFKNYWVIWKWLQLLNDPNDATFASKDMFPNGAPTSHPDVPYNYQTHMTAFALDEYDNKKAEFTFKYAFPTTLGELDYNHRDDSQLQTSFTFVFNQLDINLL